MITEIVMELLDVDSYAGLRKLTKEIRIRCTELGKRFSTWTQAEASEMKSLHNLQREIMQIMQLATDNIIIAAREVAYV